MKPYMSLAVLIACALLVDSVFSVPGTGGGYELSRSAVSGDASSGAEGGGYQLAGDLGQQGGVAIRGDGYALVGGFLLELAPADCNGDGVVDLFDLAVVAWCLTGPDEAASQECICRDVDASGTVDLADYAMAQRAFNGG